MIFMGRNNEKKAIINYENSITKSKEFSVAKISNGLSLNQMQLLAYAIYTTQKSGINNFHKADFEKKFNMSQYRTEDALKDSDVLTSLKFSTEDLLNKKFRFNPIFIELSYDNGLFTVEWSPKVIDHILVYKDKHVLTDLTITANFKSGFSWTLYDYLKAHYGYWHKPVSKEVLLRLFNVENKKTYQNTAQFKRGVLDVAIAELNKFTEFKVWYKEIREGRAITGFDLHWSSGTTEAAASKKQIKELTAIVEVVFDDVFKYVNLKNDTNRERAIELVKEIESYREFTTEPICITSNRAKFLLQKANSILRELEQMIEMEQNTASQSPAFYNWLEERE